MGYKQVNEAFFLPRRSDEQYPWRCRVSRDVVRHVWRGNCKCIFRLAQPAVARLQGYVLEVITVRNYKYGTRTNEFFREIFGHVWAFGIQ